MYKGGPKASVSQTGNANDHINPANGRASGRIGQLRDPDLIIRDVF
mgnify:CR=1 FL=1